MGTGGAFVPPRRGSASMLRRGRRQASRVRDQRFVPPPAVGAFHKVISSPEPLETYEPPKLRLSLGDDLSRRGGARLMNLMDLLRQGGDRHDEYEDFVKRNEKRQPRPGAPPADSAGTSTRCGWRRQARARRWVASGINPPLRFSRSHRTAASGQTRACPGVPTSFVAYTSEEGTSHPATTGRKCYRYGGRLVRPP